MVDSSDKQYLYSKSEKIRALLEDAEIPDAYKEESIKTSFTEMVTENKKIIDDAFAIYSEYTNKETTALLGKTGAMQKSLDKIAVDIKSEQQKMPDIIKSMFSDIIDG